MFKILLRHIVEMKDSKEGLSSPRSYLDKATLMLNSLNVIALHMEAVSHFE